MQRLINKHKQEDCHSYKIYPIRLSDTTQHNNKYYDKYNGLSKHVNKKEFLC